MGSLCVLDVAPTAAEDPITEGTGLVKHVIVADVHHAPREVPSVPSIALPATAREVTSVPSNNLPAADLEVTLVPSNDLPAPAREVTPVPSIDFPAEDDLALLEADEMFDIDDEMFDEMFDEGDEVFDIGGQVVLDVTSPETGVFLNVELPNQDVEPMELLGGVDDHDIDLMSTIEGPLEEGGEVDFIDEDPQAAVNENFVPDPSIVEAGKLAREKLKSNKMKAPKVPIQRELLQKEKEINAAKKLADSIAKALEKAKLDAEKLALKKQKEADKLFKKNKKSNIQANTLKNYFGFGKKRALSDSSDASWVPSPSPPHQKK